MIQFDYDNTPLARDNENGIHNYIEALVHEVRYKAEQHGLQAAQFAFKMPSGLWHEVACHYACLYKGNNTVPLTEIVMRAVTIKEERKLLIDGVEYPVELSDEIDGHTIYLIPDNEKWPSPAWGRIFNVGYSED